MNKPNKQYFFHFRHEYCGLLLNIAFAVAFYQEKGTPYLKELALTSSPTTQF
jgi:hypothetical protein